ncbi:hypothetical protein HPP92_015382 [Vanilla planifolia]|uniref:Uncharacterized protein n=1 Tax=Vanilla planifolia TaxID=51239 RepID=A0A835QRA8_VANPL|nr:hypothetical protein HPP92_015382 [Vanilla planifolia]
MGSRRAKGGENPPIRRPPLPHPFHRFPRRQGEETPAFRRIPQIGRPPCKPTTAPGQGPRRHRRHLSSTHVWGGQHLMPPYGTRSPAHRCTLQLLFMHPSLAVGMGYLTGDFGNGKAKGSHGKLEGGKASAGSSDDSQRSSRGSATEGSSDTRDNSPGLQDDIKKRTFKDAFQEGRGEHCSLQLNQLAVAKAEHRNFLYRAPGRTTLSGPATNLNIGMDIWNHPTAGCVPFKVGSNETGPNGTVVDRSWIQDERELKRERGSSPIGNLQEGQDCENRSAKEGGRAEQREQCTQDRVGATSKVCKDLEVKNQQITEELNNVRGNSSSGSAQNGDHGSQKLLRLVPIVPRRQEDLPPGWKLELNSR